MKKKTNKLAQISKRAKEQKRKLHSLAQKKYYYKKKFHKAVEQGNQAKQVKQLKKLQVIHADHDKIKKRINKKRFEEAEEKLLNAVMGVIERGEKDLEFGFFYYQRKQILDFVFGQKKRIKIIKFLGNDVKTQADKITSWIDNMLAELSSENILVLIVRKKEVIDYYITNGEEFEERNLKDE